MAQPGRARDSYDLFGDIPMSWVQIPLDPLILTHCFNKIFQVLHMYVYRAMYAMFAIWIILSVAVDPLKAAN